VSIIEFIKEYCQRTFKNDELKSQFTHFTIDPQELQKNLQLEERLSKTFRSLKLDESELQGVLDDNVEGFTEELSYMQSEFNEKYLLLKLSYESQYKKVISDSFVKKNVLDHHQNVTHDSSPDQLFFSDLKYSMKDQKKIKADDF